MTNCRLTSECLKLTWLESCMLAHGHHKHEEPSSVLWEDWLQMRQGCLQMHGFRHAPSPWVGVGCRLLVCCTSGLRISRSSYRATQKLKSYGSTQASCASNPVPPGLQDQASFAT